MSNYLTQIARRAAGLAPVPGAPVVTAPRPTPNWDVSGPGAGKPEPDVRAAHEKGDRTPPAADHYGEYPAQREESAVERSDTARAAAADDAASTINPSVPDKLPLQRRRNAPTESAPEIPRLQILAAPQSTIPAPVILPRPVQLPTVQEPEKLVEPPVEQAPRQSVRSQAADEEPRQAADAARGAPTLPVQIPNAMRNVEIKATLHRSDVSAVDLPVTVARLPSEAKSNSPNPVPVFPAEKFQPHAQHLDQPPAQSPGQKRAVAETISETEAEQQVTIHIGAIEIRSPDEPRTAEQPVAQASPAPVPGGFDSFARLRVYAPWNP